MAAHQSLVRPRDVEARGIARESLLRLYRQGLLARPARGVYALAESPVTEHHSLDVLRSRKATVDEIHRFVKVCRVANVMLAYLESAVWRPRR